MNSGAMPNTGLPARGAQVAVLLVGVALAVFAADLNSWMLHGIGSAAVRAWKQDLGLPFELLWIVGLFIIGLMAGVVAGAVKLKRSQVLVLLAGPFAVSTLVGSLLAVFVFGVYSGPWEAASMLLYPVALPVGVLLSANAVGAAESAA